MQIDLTNVCGLNCVYCSRYNRHIRKDQRYFMDLNYFEKVLQSLKTWPNKIGIIGGEPLLHPQFEEICEIMRSHFPPNKFQLFTSHKLNFEKYKNTIDKTFGYLAFNEHTDYQRGVCLFQPITVAINEAVPNKNLKNQLINNCWVADKWCPSVNNKGGFFCEVAAALDVIFDGPGGYDINEFEWWKKTPEQFKDQIERYCDFCGMAIPMNRELIKNETEKFTPKLLQKFKDYKLSIDNNKIEIFNKIFTDEDIQNKLNSGEWQPWKNRGDLPNGEA
jgi:hypothetical protein